MGHGARVGRVESIAVADRFAARGMGEAGKVEWDGGMLRRADGGGRMAQLVWGTAGGGRSVVELVRQRLVEHEVWDGLGPGGIEGGSLILEIADHAFSAVPWPARGRDGRGCVREL